MEDPNYPFNRLSAVLDAVLHALGLLVYHRWSSAARFFVATAWFYAASFVHERFFADRP